MLTIFRPESNVLDMHPGAKPAFLVTDAYPNLLKKVYRYVYIKKKCEVPVINTDKFK
jgi:hypothetical protein